MKAPDKIYIAETPNKLIEIWSDEPIESKPYITEHEYIRKDIHDETIETAEDHAMFAGREKMREELLEWANKELETLSWYYEKMKHVARTVGDNSIWGKIEAFKKVIEKIKKI